MAVARARSVAGALAILVLWPSPEMQGSEGYLALAAVQALIVLTAGIHVVTGLEGQVTAPLSANYHSST